LAHVTDITDKISTNINLSLSIVLFC